MGKQIAVLVTYMCNLRHNGACLNVLLAIVKESYMTQYLLPVQVIGGTHYTWVGLNNSKISWDGNKYTHSPSHIVSFKNEFINIHPECFTLTSWADNNRVPKWWTTSLTDAIKWSTLLVLWVVLPVMALNVFQNKGIKYYSGIKPRMCAGRFYLCTYFHVLFQNPFCCAKNLQ